MNSSLHSQIYAPIKFGLDYIRRREMIPKAWWGFDETGKIRRLCQATCAITPPIELNRANTEERKYSYYQGMIWSKQRGDLLFNPPDPRKITHCKDELREKFIENHFKYKVEFLYWPFYSRYEKISPHTGKIEVVFEGFEEFEGYPFNRGDYWESKIKETQLFIDGWKGNKQATRHPAKDGFPGYVTVHKCAYHERAVEIVLREDYISAEKPEILIVPEDGDGFKDLYKLAKPAKYSYDDTFTAFKKLSYTVEPSIHDPLFRQQVRVEYNECKEPIRSYFQKASHLEYVRHTDEARTAVTVHISAQGTRYCRPKYNPTIIRPSIKHNPLPKFPIISTGLGFKVPKAYVVRFEGTKILTRYYANPFHSRRRKPTCSEYLQKRVELAKARYNAKDFAKKSQQSVDYIRFIDQFRNMKPAIKLSGRNAVNLIDFFVVHQVSYEWDRRNKEYDPKFQFLGFQDLDNASVKNHDVRSRPIAYPSKLQAIIKLKKLFGHWHDSESDEEVDEEADFCLDESLDVDESVESEHDEDEQDFQFEKPVEKQVVQLARNKSMQVESDEELFEPIEIGNEGYEEEITDDESDAKILHLIRTDDDSDEKILHLIGTDDAKIVHLIRTVHEVEELEFEDESQRIKDIEEMEPLVAESNVHSSLEISEIGSDHHVDDVVASNESNEFKFTPSSKIYLKPKPNVRVYDDKRVEVTGHGEVCAQSVELKEVIHRQVVTRSTYESGLTINEIEKATIVQGNAERAITHEGGVFRDKINYNPSIAEHSRDVSVQNATFAQMKAFRPDLCRSLVLYPESDEEDSEIQFNTEEVQTSVVEYARQREVTTEEVQASVVDDARQMEVNTEEIQSSVVDDSRQMEVNSEEIQSSVVDDARQMEVNSEEIQALVVQDHGDERDDELIYTLDYQDTANSEDEEDASMEERNDNIVA